MQVLELLSNIWMFFILIYQGQKNEKKKKIGETKGGRITLCQNKNQSYEFHPYVSKLKD